MVTIVEPLSSILLDKPLNLYIPYIQKSLWLFGLNDPAANPLIILENADEFYGFPNELYYFISFSCFFSSYLSILLFLDS